MAVEIRELVIKTTIDNSQKKDKSKKEGLSLDQGSLVQECVEQVMVLLEQQRSR